MSRIPHGSALQSVAEHFEASLSLRTKGPVQFTIGSPSLQRYAYLFSARQGNSGSCLPALGQPVSATVERLFSTMVFTSAQSAKRIVRILLKLAHQSEDSLLRQFDWQSRRALYATQSVTSCEVLGVVSPRL